MNEKWSNELYLSVDNWSFLSLTDAKAQFMNFQINNQPVGPPGQKIQAAGAHWKGNVNPPSTPAGIILLQNSIS